MDYALYLLAAFCRLFTF